MFTGCTTVQDAVATAVAVSIAIAIVKTSKDCPQVPRARRLWAMLVFAVAIANQH